MDALMEDNRLTSPELIWERLMAQTRYGRYAHSVESKMVWNVLERSLEPGVLLDVGCEGGRWAKVFADRGWQIIATDVDARSLRVCKSRIPNSHCILSDPGARQLPAEDNSIDVALCIEVGPVIHTDWAVSEFARILRLGGSLVGVCWNRRSWRGFLYHNVRVLRRSGSNALVGYPIAYKDFRRQMVEHGFRFARELGYAWVPFRRTSNSILLNPLTAIERFSGLQHFVSSAPMVAFVSEKVTHAPAQTKRSDHTSGDRRLSAIR